MTSFLWRFESRTRSGWYYALGVLLRLYLAAHGCRSGKRLRCEGWPQFGNVPRGNIRMGDRVCIGKRVRFDVTGEGKLDIGDRVTFRQDVVVSCLVSITIGEMAGIAEGVSIRDNDHLPVIEEALMPRYYVAEPVIIGRYVGIGHSATVTRGTVIAAGAVIGPLCITAHGMPFVENGLYFGNPPRLLGKRRPASELLAAKNLGPHIMDLGHLLR